MNEVASKPVVFEPMPKIARLNRPCVITEKIDGTNACVIVHEDGTVLAASKNTVLTPDVQDNHGFRKWVEANADQLRALGPGIHRGEWWGKGIGKRHPTVEKTFSLFNVGRWANHGAPLAEGQAYPPACCKVVPVLREIPTFDNAEVRAAVSQLAAFGSTADPACKRPEGVIVFHTAKGYLFKVTCEKDEKHKSSQE
jgi:hypothetical protein